jgi:hypothetical protein
MIDCVSNGARTSTLGAAAPSVGWASGPLGAVQAADREISRHTAIRAPAVAGFAASRPASADRAQGERGAMSAERWAARAEVLRSVSEWATPELAIALNLTQKAAEGLLEESLTLVYRLPGTLAALESGLVHRGASVAPDRRGGTDRRGAAAGGGGGRSAGLDGEAPPGHQPGAVG